MQHSEPCRMHTRTRLAATFLAALLISGCTRTETFVVESSEDNAAGRIIRSKLDGPNFKLRFVKKDGGELVGTAEKSGGKLTLAAPGKPTLKVDVARFRSELDEGVMRGCCSNLKNLATATEMWSTDNNGRYPTSASQLVPTYLKSIPTCPAAGQDTYSESFVSRAQPDMFTFVCSGKHHAGGGVPEDHPRYTATEGLITGKQQAP